jgi:hypothetical protein
MCDGTCLDLSADPQNCGACGRTCDSGECTAGKCVVVVDPGTGGAGAGGSGAGGCQAEQTLCGGRCVMISNSNFNCGACGVECKIREHCQAGKCVR